MAGGLSGGYLTGRTTDESLDSSSKITISAQPDITEGAGTLVGAGRVWIQNALTYPTTVSITSSNPSLISVAPFVTVNSLLDNYLGVYFDLSVADDAVNEGTQIVTLTAAAEGYAPSSFTVSVYDNDPPTANAGGDVDHNRSLELRDAILSLQIATGSVTGEPYAAADISGDGNIGLAETVYILQVLAGLRLRDGAPPSVLAAAPGNWSSNVMIDSQITVTFNEDLDAASLHSGTFALTRGDRIVAGDITYQERIATFTPQLPLDFYTTYEINLRPGIKDLADNMMTAEYRSYFTTLPRPDVVATLPAANAKSAPIDGLIEVSFNFVVDPLSVNAATFVVTSDGNPVFGALKCRENKIIFTPALPLGYHKNYVVTLSQDIRAATGLYLPAEKSFSFVTTSVRTSYAYDFPITAAVLDAAGKMVYCTSKTAKKLYGINLETGVVEKEFTFDYLPEAIAVRPDKTRMYVALSTREHSDYWWKDEQEGYIAEFDLATGAKLKQFKIDIDPYDLVATTDGHIYVTSGSGQLTYLDGYNVETAARTGRYNGIHQQGRIKLHPSEQFIYIAQTSLSPVSVTKHRVSAGEITYVGRLWENPYDEDHNLTGDIFIDITGYRMLTEGGSVFSLAEENNHMQFIQDITPDYTIKAAAFDPVHAYLFTVEHNAIRAYDLTAFSREDEIYTTTYDKNFLYLSRESDRLYLIGTNANATVISLLHSPASRVTDKPQAAFSFGAASGTTLDNFLLDASASQDYLPGGGLYYLWDWDSDGIYDTPPTQDPFASHLFQQPGNIEVTLKVINNSGYSSVSRRTITITGGAANPIILDKISDMVAGDDPEIVYAIDQGSQALFYINTSTQRIVKKVDLPFAQPLAMAYAASTKSLYIVSKASGSVTVYHLASLSITELAFSSAKVGLDIAVSPMLHRIYVLSTDAASQYLTILDMDTGQVLAEAAVQGALLALDETRQRIFLAGGSVPQISKYDVHGDLLTLEQSIPACTYGASLTISPDGRHLVYPRCGGTGYGYGVSDYDSTNLDNVFGEWNLGTYPDNARFSADGARLFGTNGSDDNLYVMSAGNYRQLFTYNFPHADMEDYNVFTPNADGTVVVGFSTKGDDYHYYNGRRLYFFTIPGPEEPLPPPTLDKISAMAAGDDPEVVYAIDQASQALYYISTVSQQIVKKVALPFTQPLAMAYGAATKSLYIVSKFSGSVTVHNLDSQVITEMPFSYAKDGLDIGVAPALRRVYVLSQSATTRYLTILDMDTGQVLAEEPVNGDSLAIDATRQKIFLAGGYPDQIYKYDVLGDRLVLEQSVNGFYFGSLELSPDGRHILAGKGYGSLIYDMDSTNLNNVFGDWDLGYYPGNARFSAEGSRLLGTNDDYLFVTYANNYHQLFKKYSFPNSSDYNVFTSNADGTVVVGFSYDSYNNNDRQLFFFDISGPVEPLPASTLDKISDMVAGDDPEVVYAIDQGSQSLYYISTVTQQIVKKVALPCTEPLAMAYAAQTKSLYIVSKFSGSVTVYHLESQSITEMPFSYANDGLDIGVAPLLRRIYVLSTHTTGRYLAILDMDTGQVLAEEPVDGYSLAIDETRQKIFLAGGNFSGIVKYAVRDDHLVREQSVDGYYFGSLEISPDGRHILAGRGYGDRIYDYDALDLQNVWGEWDVGTWPKTARFSADGARLFATNGNPYDNYLYVMDAANYRQLFKYTFPQASDYSIFTTNADGTVVVGFSYGSDGYVSERRLYFFTIPGPEGEPVIPLSPDKISDMVAGDDPGVVYAIDQGNQALYYINTVSQQIEQQVILPFTQPLAMAYATATKSLYIVSKFSGSVTVYNLDSQSTTEIPFSASKDGLDIGVAPSLRRIYVLSEETKYTTAQFLTILDMDTGKVLAEEHVFRGNSLTIDEARQKIFLAGGDMNQILKYDMRDDHVIPEQSVYAGSSGGSLAISPDGRHIVYACSGGNGFSGNKVFDYDSTNLLNVLGEWDIGTYRKIARFSSDGARLFVASGAPYGSNYLYVMDAGDYQQLFEFDFPHASDYGIFTPNTDGTVVVGFSYYLYGNSDRKLYFFAIPGN